MGASDPTPAPGTLTWRFDADPAALDEARVRESGWRVEHLRRAGIAPATVIDVGAANGTRALYEAYPDARLVLIEPLVEHEPDLQRLTADGGEYHLTAVGDREGDATILVDHGAPLLSSLLARRRQLAGLSDDPEQRRIPITTLDSLRERHGWEAPFVLKIDTEGYEAHVVRGADRLLAETQLVIAEVNMAKRFEESYSFAEFVALMDSHGFAAVDVLGGQKAGRAANMICMDAVFRRR